MKSFLVDDFFTRQSTYVCFDVGLPEEPVR